MIIPQATVAASVEPVPMAVLPTALPILPPLLLQRLSEVAMEAPLTVPAAMEAVKMMLPRSLPLLPPVAAQADIMVDPTAAKASAAAAIRQEAEAAIQAMKMPRSLLLLPPAQALDMEATMA